MILPRASTEKGTLLRNFFVTVGLLGIASLLSFLYHTLANNTVNIAILYMLVIVIVARNTTGYLWGVAASVVGVIAINFFFTAPFFELNFSLEGYPITFIGMLTITLITSTTTTHLAEQTRLNLEREKILMEAEKEKMRANLLRSVSHDIRTPLTSIVGATSAVLENQDSLTEEQKRRLLTDVKEDAQWLIRVVENLLSITRMGSDTAQITKADEVAEEVLAETVRKFRKRFPQMPVHVKAPDELLVVPMDPILIEQVLGNLLENAVLHATGATEIQLSARQEENWAVFSVQDDGCGIPDELLPKLFDGTLRHNETTSGDGKRNMNIGLAVCTAIVRAHGGALSAANRPQGGAEFTFRLPLYQVKES